MGGAPSLADTEFMEKWNAILFERINGDSKLTDTENVTFFVSYGILTDERNSYVLSQRSTEIRLWTNGNVTLETTHYFQ